MDNLHNNLKDLYVRALRLHISPDNIGESHLIQSLGIDSVKMMEILTTVEDEYNFEIDNNDISPKLVDSIESLASYIKLKSHNNT